MRCLCCCFHHSVSPLPESSGPPPPITAFSSTTKATDLVYKIHHLSLTNDCHYTPPAIPGAVKAPEPLSHPLLPEKFSNIRPFTISLEDPIEVTLNLSFINRYIGFFSLFNFDFPLAVGETSAPKLLMKTEQIFKMLFERLPPCFNEKFAPINYLLGTPRQFLLFWFDFYDWHLVQIFGPLIQDFPSHSPLFEQAQAVRQFLDSPQATEIKTLDCSKKDLFFLPEIDKLSSLQSIDASRNHIHVIPQELQDLSHLSTLNFSRNNISSFPDIEKMSGLIELNLGKNKLQTLGSLPSSLQLITISENEFREIPTSVYSLMSLTHLDGSDNRIEKLEKEIANLHSLTTLNLSRNILHQLPSTLKSLNALTTLYLHKNRIRTLPEDIGHLKSLRKLYVSENSLEQLPPSLSTSASLALLSAHDNRLNFDPHPLIRSPSITRLDLRNNLLTVSNEDSLFRGECS